MVMPEALAPFRVPQMPRHNGDPAPLPYLLHCREPTDRCTRPRARSAADRAVPDRTGPAATSAVARPLGSLLEITEGGKQPIALASGNARTFLEDGDEVIMRARPARGLRADRLWRSAWRRAASLSRPN